MRIHKLQTRIVLAFTLLLLLIQAASLAMTEESTMRKVTLDATQATSMEWQLFLKPAFRIPRASGSVGAAYR